jgi:hypothetical protein
MTRQVQKKRNAFRLDVIEDDSVLDIDLDVYVHEDLYDQIRFLPKHPSISVQPLENYTVEEDEHYLGIEFLLVPPGEDISSYGSVKTMTKSWVWTVREDQLGLVFGFVSDIGTLVFEKGLVCVDFCEYSPLLSNGDAPHLYKSTAENIESIQPSIELSLVNRHLEPSSVFVIVRGGGLEEFSTVGATLERIFPAADVSFIMGLILEPSLGDRCEITICLSDYMCERDPEIDALVESLLRVHAD